MKIDMYFRDNEVKQDVINRIWDIAKLSNRHGNELMDLLGDATYEYIMRNNTNTVKKGESK